MTSIDSALNGVTRLGIDTAPIIYFVESHPQYDAVVSNVFSKVSTGLITSITSVISLTEVLTLPLRLQNNSLSQEYSDLLLHSPNFVTLPINAGIASTAADLRARYQIRTPDALQLAAALTAGCQAFLTNDMQLRRINELQVLILEDLTP